MHDIKIIGTCRTEDEKGKEGFHTRRKSSKEDMHQDLNIRCLTPIGSSEKGRIKGYWSETASQPPSKKVPSLYVSSRRILGTVAKQTNFKEKVLVMFDETAQSYTLRPCRPTSICVNSDGYMKIQLTRKRRTILAIHPPLLVSAPSR